MKLFHLSNSPVLHVGLRRSAIIICRFIPVMIILSGVGFPMILNGQERTTQPISELRERKLCAAENIRFTSTLLDEARKNEKESLNKLRLINKQIENRNSIIQNINSEIVFLDSCIAENREVTGMLTNDLEAIKKEYAGMLRFAQKNKNSFDLRIFLLSAENLNQVYKRFLYFRQYAGYRTGQAEVIIALSGIIDKKVEGMEQQKNQKLDLVKNETAENLQLEKEKEEQNRSVSILQQKQYELRKKLREQEKIQEELNLAIETLVREEGQAAAETGEFKFKLTPEQELISADFEKNRGCMPWPVERGIITDQFGVHAHPVLKQINIRNNGIDISTENGSRARAVFDGEVSRVFAVSEGNLAVIIRHGSFLTVYSNLKEVWVKAGQKVSLKQEIGTIFSDMNDGNKTVLKFQIWKESTKLNPRDWITN